MELLTVDSTSRTRRMKVKGCISIVKAALDVIVPNKSISFVIPTGIAIQHARNKYKNLTRDGFHLSIPFGRYIAALTWFCTFTNRDIDVLETDILSKEQLETAKNSVKKATRNNLGR
jgi:hypothetical protein